jgi:hypothetical protein
MIKRQAADDDGFSIDDTRPGAGVAIWGISRLARAFPDAAGPQPTILQEVTEEAGRMKKGKKLLPVLLL